MAMIETTLLLLRRDDEIMLALKKRGFGAGKYNGVGGKLEGDETPEEAMIRETKEEIGITPLEYEKIGIVSFDEMYKGEKQRLIFHLYVATKWDREPFETEEMKPYWFNINDIPYDSMFPDDKYWMPLLLEGNKFDAYFEFDEEWNVLQKEITIKTED